MRRWVIVSGLAIATLAVTGLAIFGVPFQPEQPPVTPPPPTAPTTTGSFSSEEPADFVDGFRAAVQRGDSGLLLSRLHPIVIDLYGIDSCRTHIEKEVLDVANYVRVGPVEGPTTRTFETPSGPTSAITYTAEVVFDFRGETFSDVALYGPVDGLLHWFTQC